jgi:hypothetical protein
MDYASFKIVELMALNYWNGLFLQMVMKSIPSFQGDFYGGNNFWK